MGVATEVGYWSFNEGSGTAIADSSGSGNNGSLVNGGSAWLAAGRSGSALYFGGTVESASTRVEIADHTSLRLSTAGSIAVWIRSDDIIRDAPILAKEGDGRLAYWFGTFGATVPGQWGPLLDHDGSSAAWDFYGREQGEVPLGVWTHLAVTWDGSQVKYYKNGGLSNTVAWGGGPIFQSDARLFIGANSEYNFTAFKGAIDEVHIYNNAISAGDVANLANPVPEPATLLLGGAGLAAAVRRRRRSR